MLEDLVTAAVNEAVRKVKDIITREAIDMVKPEFPGMFLA
jgi:DNA-binding protein YbaB